jgi:hypothetical protein
MSGNNTIRKLTILVVLGLLLHLLFIAKFGENDENIDCREATISIERKELVGLETNQTGHGCYDGRTKNDRSYFEGPR